MSTSHLVFGNGGEPLGMVLGKGKTMRKIFSASLIGSMVLASAVSSAQLSFEGFTFRGLELQNAETYSPTLTVRFGQFRANGNLATGTRDVRLIVDGSVVAFSNDFTQQIAAVSVGGSTLSTFGNVGHVGADVLFFDQGEGFGINSGNQGDSLQKRIDGAEQLRVDLGSYVTTSAVVFGARTSEDGSATAFFFRNGIQVGQTDFATTVDGQSVVSNNQPFDEIRLQAAEGTVFSIRGIGLTGADAVDAEALNIRFGFLTFNRGQWSFQHGITVREVINGVQTGAQNAGQNQAAPAVGGFTPSAFGNAGNALADVTWSDAGEGLGINSGRQSGSRQKRIDDAEVLQIDFPTYATSTAKFFTGSMGTLPTSVKVEFLFGEVSVGTTILQTVSANTGYALENSLPFNKVRLSVAPSVLP